MVVHTCKPSTWVDEAKDQNFRVSFDYRERPSQKNQPIPKKKKKPQKTVRACIDQQSTSLPGMKF